MSVESLYYWQEETWEEEDWPGWWQEDDHFEDVAASPAGVDGITIVGLGLILFIGFTLLAGWAPAAAIPQSQPVTADLGGAERQPPRLVYEGESGALALPYDDYLITQGPHGFSYGHMAIDIAGGKGATIRSPINGVITARYVDDVGNTTLVVENDDYVVSLLHGNFSVEPGASVRLGQPIGEESNIGNTFDMQGRSCRGRDCGYHTHLNVYDRRLESNINPLEVVERR